MPGRGAELAGRWRARQLELSWLRTSMDRWVDFDQVTEDALVAALHEPWVPGGASAIDAALLAEVAAAFRELPLQPRARGVLAELRDAGLATGILTNASRATLDAVIGRTGLVVDHALSADGARRFKPSPAVYALAREVTGRPVEQIGFVTGNGWDAAGGSAFGFHVAWLRESSSPWLPAVGAPEPVEATWDSLTGIFLR